MLLNKSSFSLMERSLDAASLRQKVIAHNIANVDTPHYKRSEVKFEQLLQKELNAPAFSSFRTDSRHYEFGKSQVIQPEIMRDTQSHMNNNLNNVDIDYEMALMAKNQLRYNTIVQQINADIKKTRTAIGGRV
ncbi:flagellar basal body rod protein FlgB [Paenibacillus sp. YYML68]|uniref:flagellar basal body rod protein FlgB n=1 Tax=Paenibacillus sp. YYML68 TaxID=2909250 RepID=UPI0024921E1A|nr:flagellar basal body rod protein FlgB [Paenibacillus sp. YYML68]